jgi:cobalamin-dependent methionine synthase I
MMLIIGERLNVFASKKVRTALEAKDERVILDIAKDQLAQGAQYLDVHAEGWDDMKWMLETVQKSGASICLDSPDPEVIRKGLAMPGVKFLNSLAGGRLDCFKEAKEHNVKVVGLLHDVSAAEVVEAAKRASFSFEDLYLDPAVMPVSVDAANARKLIEKHRDAKRDFPGVKTVVGISNVTHGMPRPLEIRAAILVSLLNDGLDAAICNPAELGFYARAVAIIKDDGSGTSTVDYIRAFRKDEAAKKAALPPK